MSIHWKQIMMSETKMSEHVDDDTQTHSEADLGGSSDQVKFRTPDGRDDSGSVVIIPVDTI